MLRPCGGGTARRWHAHEHTRSDPAPRTAAAARAAALRSKHGLRCHASSIETDDASPPSAPPPAAPPPAAPPLAPAAEEAAEACAVAVSVQNCSLTKSAISRCLAATNHSVGVWHGPYESSRRLGSPKRRRAASRSARVSSRVKATPTLRSISCRASTAAASAADGLPSRAIAPKTSRSLTDEKCARETRSGVLANCGSTRSTSKQMFSPSRSQSSHRQSQPHPAASACRCASTPSRSDVSSTTLRVRAA